MINRKISSRYAASLMDLTEEMNNLDIMYQDAKLVRSVLEQSRDLRRVLVSPVIKSAVKVAILDAVFNGKINTELQKFIRFIIEKNREDYLLGIMLRFLELRNEKLGVADIEVRTTVEFTEAQSGELRKNLESILNKKVQLHYVIDKNILGGFIAKVGDTLYDASVKNQLVNLKKQLLQGSAF